MKTTAPMKPIGAAEIEAAVRPMLLHPLPALACEQLAQYVELLGRWNAKMNLTAVRDPSILVSLHVAECLRAAQAIPAGAKTVLDYGSGAGLPGIPIQIARPGLSVTLAESQGKKSAFLQECRRELNLRQMDIFPGRVASLPADRRYDLISLRAVDRMESALKEAPRHLAPKGCCLVLTSALEAAGVHAACPALTWSASPVPRTGQRVILLGSRRG